MKDLTVYTTLEADALQFVPGAVFEDSEFRGVDFTVYPLKSILFLDCRFENCNFANQKLINGSYRGVAFKACNLMGINWTSVKTFRDVNFQDCKMNLSIFQNMDLKRVNMTDCLVSETDFSGANLGFSNLSGALLSGANFEGADLSGADLRNSRDYCFDVRTTKIKGTKFSFPDVVSLITALGAEVDI